MPYPAKVLLFGEHTVLRGGRGLAVPYFRRSLTWAQGTSDDRLLAFADYLADQFTSAELDLDRLHDDLHDGQYLAGDIPMGYGLGSSGAVCAAVYDRYRLPLSEKPSTRGLRQLLARMERHFHQQSSGIDPLVAYLQEPLHLPSGGDAGAVNLPPGWHRPFFVVDTGISRSSAPLIEAFTQAYDGALAEMINQGWMPAVDMAINTLIEGDTETLWRSFYLISELQLNFFADFIPSAFYSAWDGEGAYRLKLCGAGGGGMLLGMARDREIAERTFGERLQWLPAT